MSVRLEEPTDDHFATLARIRRDRVTQDILLAYPPDAPPSDEEVGAWIERRSKDPAGRFFSVIADGQCVGFVQLTDIHRKGARAFVGIALDDRYRGKGLGRSAIQEVVLLARDRLGMTKLMAEVRADNQRSVGAFAAAGFHQVGALRSHYLGQDVLLMERLL